MISLPPRSMDLADTSWSFLAEDSEKIGSFKLMKGSLDNLKPVLTEIVQSDKLECVGVVSEEQVLVMHIIWATVVGYFGLVGVETEELSQANVDLLKLTRPDPDYSTAVQTKGHSFPNKMETLTSDWPSSEISEKLIHGCGNLNWSMQLNESKSPGMRWKGSDFWKFRNLKAQANNYSLYLEIEPSGDWMARCPVSRLSDMFRTAESSLWEFLQIVVGR